MTSKRVLIIANKWWEADPLCGVLTHDKARPRLIQNLQFLHFPAIRSANAREVRPPDPKPEPRIVLECCGAMVEVWCLEELVNPAESSSSSAEKARVLPGAINYGPLPSLVIAFGTAGSREHLDVNGSVVIGSRIFIHDPSADATDRTGLWLPPKHDEIIDSDFPGGTLSRLIDDCRYEAEARFLTCPVRPAAPPLIIASEALVSLGVVNILNPQDYVWADAETVDAFIRKNNRIGQIGSIETTHGVIRSASRAPFIYVSGIPNGAAMFDYELRPRVYSQSFVASHNAAIAIAWLLPHLISTLND